MVQSLLASTAEIRRRAARLPRAPSARAFFARDTRSAILTGSLHAAAALTEYSLGRAQEVVGHPPRLLLSGGGARDLQRVLAGREPGVPVRRVDNLVLRGLAVLAQQESG
jgi:type III pantothenate kinase